MQVSIIMPCYNVAAFVGEAVRSVAAQTWPDTQLIAIDDGSDDGTADIVAASAADWTGQRRLTLLRQANAGASAARNAGLAAATGDVIAFLDADDRLDPRLIETLVGRLQADASLDMVFPLYSYIDESGDPIGVQSQAPLGRYTPVDLMMDNPVHSATGVVLRGSAARSLGGFDETLRACIDLDFWVRLGALRPDNIAVEPQVLVEYRKRAGQITGDWRRMETNWRRVHDKMTRAGTTMTARQFRLSRSRRCLFWGTIAYNAQDYPAARGLTAEMWRRDPGFAARHPLARVRTLACVATLLPRPMHDRLRRWFNGG